MANPKNPSYRLTGINPLAYMGVEPYTPPQLLTQQRQPTTNDTKFNIGTLWTIRNPNEVWMLVDLALGVATWVQLYPGGGGGGASSFPCDVGTANEVGGVLNVFGTSPITTSGAGNTVTVILENGTDGQVIIGGGAGPAWANIIAGDGITITEGPNSLEISSTDGEGIDSIVTNSGSAAPVAGVINLLGDNLINTAASGNTVTVALDLSLDGQIPIGSSAGPTLMANITSTDGSITVDNGHNTIDISVTDAFASEYVCDTGSATPSMGVLNVEGANIVGTFGSGNTVTVGLIDGLDGQIPIAASGNPTEYAYLTSGDGSITITNGPNTIDLVAAGGGGGGFTTKLTKFTSSGTWTKSANAKTVTCILWSGGCGGGSGAKNALDNSANAAMGGGGGSGSSVVYYSAPAEFFSATQSVVVGAGGLGGASVSTPTTQGVPGAVGSFSSIGSIITGPGVTPSMAGGYGSGGLGGYITNTSLAPSQQMGQLTLNCFGQIRPGATASQTSTGIAQGGKGAKGSSSVGPATTPDPTYQATPFLASGGGGGGSGTANNSQSSGAAGGTIYQFDTITAVVAGGTAGSTSGTPTGGNGNIPVNTNGLITGGSGGGGGAGERTSDGNVAGAGGNGAAPGGGGGGGGGGRTSNSGAGGNGARGEVWVYEDISGTSNNTGAFMAYLGSNTARNLSSGLHYVGTNLAFTESFDIDSAFYPGNGSGSEAVYTAPVTGIYYFTFTVGVLGPSSSGEGTPTAIIVGPDFSVANTIGRTTTYGALVNRLMTANTYLSLNAGDEVKFAVDFPVGSYGLYGSILSYDSGTESYATYVSGGLIG